MDPTPQENIVARYLDGNGAVGRRKVLARAREWEAAHRAGQTVEVGLADSLFVCLALNPRRALLALGRALYEHAVEVPPGVQAMIDAVARDRLVELEAEREMMRLDYLAWRIGQESQIGR